jgi:CRISPR-associated protein Cmr2
MENQYILVIDVPGIKEYVFGTDRLVEIRGASALLDILNRRKTEIFLKDNIGKNNVECVFSAGGAGQFVITVEEDSLKTCVKELKEFFVRKSKGGLRLLCGWAEFSEENYSDCLKQAHIELKKEKEENSIIPCSQIHAGYIRECDSCSGMASQPNVYGDEKRFLCDICVEKVAYGKGKGLWGEFVQYCETKGVAAKSPGTFEEVGERCRVRKDYTALVYADGNAMGKLVKAIQTKEQFRTFSETVDQSVREACHEALFENCKPVDGKIPANILLLGGDDLMVYLSADTAFPFAIDAARKFEEKTKQKFASDTFFSQLLRGKGLTISLGIAYGKSHTPFYIMFGQSEELLKSAKKVGSQDKNKGEYYAPTYIDFHISSSYNQIKVSDSRKTHLHLYEPSAVKLYQKPYSLTDAQSLLDHARNLIKSDIPGTRLKRLGYAPFQGKINGTLECLKIYTRTRKEQRTAIWNALDRFGCLFPWKEVKNEKRETVEVTTMLTDLIELAGFTELQIKADAP